jgi:tetratricopeptide (TPR) repeat protein
MAEKNQADNQTEKNSNLSPEPSLKKMRLLFAASVFVIAFLLYAYTLAPTATLVDSGELILAARTLGVAHPPGFPLYVLLAHVATLLPLGNIAVRVHFASALFAAFAAGFMFLLVTEISLLASNNLTSAKPNKESRKKKSKPTDEITNTNSASARLALVFAPAVTASLLFAFSRTLWAYATIAEVYTLNAMLTVIVLFLMMSWRRGIFDARNTQTNASDKELLLAAFVFGLALGVHHVTVILLLPALAAFVFATEGIKFFKSKRLLFAALVSFAGLSIYLYLPLAAKRSPLMNWGDPRTLEKFWWHITGRQYQVFFDFSFERIAEFFKLSLREFGFAWIPLALIFAVAGFVYLFKRDKALCYFLALIIAADVVYCLGYEIDEDKDAYYLPAFIAMTIAVGCGMRWFIQVLPATKLQKVFTPLRASLILILIPWLAFAGNFAYNNRKNYFIAEDYTNNILNAMGQRGMLLTNDWQVYSPMLYALAIEQRRKDVVVLDLNQLRRSWYFDYLNQAYPALIEASRQQVDEYLEDLQSWEQNPDAYAKSVKLTERINRRFYDMIFSFITNHLKDAPVYATQEIIINRGGADMELTSFLNEKYTLIPEGLIFQVGETGKVSLPDRQPIMTRGLADSTLKFEADDVVTKKVFPVYVSMLTNSGRFFAMQNQHLKALEYYQQALALDANYSPAKNFLNISLEALQKPGTAK